MKIREITSYLEELFPISIQESYDNCGLILGNSEEEIRGVMLCLNLTTEVLAEAIQKECNLIISHHPLIFSGIKKINDTISSHRIIKECIKKDISVYAIHTNADKQFPGLNSYIASAIGLENIKVLEPATKMLKKLIVFCPESHTEKVREAIFEAGAGKIGKYDCCSFNIEGLGSFRAGEEANPFVGNKNELHFEKEVRIETIFPDYLQTTIINKMLSAHPYEEVAYDIYSLENTNPAIGLGAIGDLKQAEELQEFLKKVKEVFKSPSIRYSGKRKNKIQKVAICGGSGASLIKTAKHAGADIYISSDFKYHDFEIPFSEFLIVDAGHYETEIMFKEFLISILLKKFTNFAIHFSKSEVNHILYY